MITYSRLCACTLVRFVVSMLIRLCACIDTNYACSLVCLYRYKPLSLSCRVFFVHEFLIILITRAHTVRTGKKPINYNVGEALFPDHWFEPKVVWELQAADLSKSSVHRGGVNSGKLGGRGVGLRLTRNHMYLFSFFHCALLLYIHLQIFYTH